MSELCTPNFWRNRRNCFWDLDAGQVNTLEALKKKTILVEMWFKLTIILDVKKMAMLA